MVQPNNASSIKVLPGEIAIPDVLGSDVRYRRNTVETAVSWANLDAGSEVNDTQYYVYAVADADDAPFEILVSVSDSAPAGATYYRKIGYFYNDPSGNIKNVGNIKGGDVPNIIKATGTTDTSTTSTTYVDIPDMEAEFYSTGRPVHVYFVAPIHVPNGSDDYVKVAIDIDGTRAIESWAGGYSIGGENPQGNQPHPICWLDNLSPGRHTIKTQWKVSGSVANQYAATNSSIRLMIVEEK